MEVLKQRIAQRNRSFEHHIEDDYLLNLKEDYLTFYNAMKSEGANVVLINTSEIDFVKNDSDYQSILEKIRPMIEQLNMNNYKVPQNAIITIAGTVGVGKSTLTQALADKLNFKTSFENVDHNPYLDKFYDDFERWSFHLQIYF